MVDRLLSTGYVHVDGEQQVSALYEVYKDLMGKGHALHYAEETRERKLLGASLYHYKSCVICQPNRGIPT
jgi:hypothetical protein